MKPGTKTTVVLAAIVFLVVLVAAFFVYLTQIDDPMPVLDSLGFRRYGMGSPSGASKQCSCLGLRFEGPVQAGGPGGFHCIGIVHSCRCFYLTYTIVDGATTGSTRHEVDCSCPSGTYMDESGKVDYCNIFKTL